MAACEWSLESESWPDRDAGAEAATEEAKGVEQTGTGESGETADGLEWSEVSDGEDQLASQADEGGAGRVVQEATVWSGSLQ